MDERILATRLRERLGERVFHSLRVSSTVSQFVDRPWLTLASSHLGHSRLLQARVCRFVSQSMLKARQDGSVLLIAAGSAIEPWARRAAELFGVPTITVWVNPRAGTQTTDIVIAGDRTLQRDSVIISLADRVDCPLVRAGGKIESAVLDRLRGGADTGIRVGIHDAADQKTMRSAARLMSQGALGWYISNRPERTRLSGQATIVDNDWFNTEDEWLVHCTRAPSRSIPGEREQQARDAMLLATQTAAVTPLAALRRIVRSKRLIASAVTSDRRYPVVCFSARSLASLLSERTYRPHLHRWDYEPYGVAIRKEAAIEAGLQPVIYGSPEQRGAIGVDEGYRFQALGKTYDWTSEREWRCLGDVDLTRFETGDVRLFVADPSDAISLGDHFPISVVGLSAQRH
ncbi:MAG: hypothetical protein AAFX06_01595 [Planctomycetota bacterium]